jgi:hypothetical protein
MTSTAFCIAAIGLFLVSYGIAVSNVLGGL